MCNGIWNTRACKSPPEVYHRRATFFRIQKLFAHFPREDWLYCWWKPWTRISTRFIYEALLARGFVERVYIATQAANACLNTRDRSVYRPSSYLCTLRAKQICLRPLFVSWELREARSSRSHWCEFTLVEIARRGIEIAMGYICDDVSVEAWFRSWFRCAGLFVGFDAWWKFCFVKSISFLCSLRMFVRESINLFI